MGTRTVRCPHCGETNRSIDRTCWACDRELRVVPPQQPGPAPVEQGQPPRGAICVVPAASKLWPVVLPVACAAVLVAAGALVVGAVRYSAELKARRQALAALVDIGAATEVGVTLMKYSDLLVQANQQLTRARAASPYQGAGRFWRELTGAMDCYERARRAWEEKIEADDPLMEELYESRLQREWLNAWLHIRDAQEHMRGVK